MIGTIRPTNVLTPTVRHGSRFSFWAALSMSILAAGTLAIAISTPPRSGPFCLDSCTTYPYLDTAGFFPRDYLWMYPPLILTLVFVVCMATIHQYAAPEKQVFSLIGLSFAIMTAAVITIDYFIQISVIQPSLLKQEAEGLALISQYNPHGIFIALEALGYLLMSVAYGFAAAVFTGPTRIERVLRWLLASGAGLAVGGFVLLSLLYGHELEYRFEIFVIMIDWLVLIIGGALLSIVFKRASHTEIT